MNMSDAYCRIRVGECERLMCVNIWYYLKDIMVYM